MMDQDDVKKNLLKLHDCAEDFTLVFSGKKNKKVNGLYKSNKKEIVINNRNFEDTETGNNLLLYTAMHELAHHIQFTELNQKSIRAHTVLFFATLDDLVDIAEKKGIYKMPIDEDTQRLIDQAKEISREIAALQRKLGQVLLQLHGACENKGIRYEDVIERKAQIARQTEKKARKACNLHLSGEIGVDIQEAAIKERDEGKIEAIVNAGQKGKSIDQAKKNVAKPIDHEDETVSLMKEKARIEKTIASLKRRLEELAEQLKSREDS
jgi:Zn-dependent peptidase ImmA (M78 family)